MVAYRVIYDGYDYLVRPEVTKTKSSDLIETGLDDKDFGWLVDINHPKLSSNTNWPTDIDKIKKAINNFIIKEKLNTFLDDSI